MSDDQKPAEDPRIAEARHRMANNFQLIAALSRMRGQRQPDAETKRQMLWLADAVAALGSLDRRSREGFIDFAEFLTEIAPAWRRRHCPKAPEIRLECESVRVGPHASSALALISHELVSNALIHAIGERADGSLTVCLRRLGEDRCELIVEDDGPGLNDAAPRFGLWLVNSLTTQLRGQLSFEDFGGLKASLVFAL